ncbi:YqzK family protein [Paenibacillus soyae]|uniref:YqzK family protein n=1 Tax=Paenibacillus soyae TaxID=2969249 RepID=A0A9X2MSD5_9BACL|nr:YqzK family protein [Paenibacillus soyae]MCR2803082.1 YqzK family protein [Paenibacillus soyae]
MVFSIRGWASRLLFLAVFAILLFVAAGGYRWLIAVVSPVQPYSEPKGEAMKVIAGEPSMPDSAIGAERLRWFYWYGE